MLMNFLFMLRDLRKTNSNTKLNHNPNPKPTKPNPTQPRIWTHERCINLGAAVWAPSFHRHHLGAMLCNWHVIEINVLCILFELKS